MVGKGEKSGREVRPRKVEKRGVKEGKEKKRLDRKDVVLAEGGMAIVKGARKEEMILVGLCNLLLSIARFPEGDPAIL